MLESFRSGKFDYKRVPLEEQKNRGILGRLAGIIADTKNPTRNGRLYSKDLWENVFNNDIMKEKIANHLVLGELGHPDDREEIDMSKAAICLAEQPKMGDDGSIYGVFDILNTPNGKILKTLCDYGCNIGVSSRGTGDLYTDDDGNEAVDPDTYNCECWDAVVVPAVESARLHYVTEALDTKKYNKTLKQKLEEELAIATPEDRKLMEESLESMDITLNEARVLTKSGPTARQEEHKIVDSFVDEKGERHFKLDNNVWVTEKDVDSIEASPERVAQLDAEHAAKEKAEAEEAKGADVKDATVTESAEDFDLNKNWEAIVKALNQKGVSKDALTRVYNEMKDAANKPEQQGDVKVNEACDESLESFKKFLAGPDSKELSDKIGEIIANEFERLGLDASDIDNYAAAYEKLDQEGRAKLDKIAKEESINEDYDAEAKSLVKDYYSNKFDLSELHDKLERLFGNKKDAFTWLAANDAKIKNESISENCGDKKVVESEAGDAGELKELQEALVKANKLEQDNLSLQEKLSVSNAKAKDLEEELKKYKASTASLSETAKQVKPLKEELANVTSNLNRSEDDLRTSKQRLEKFKNNNVEIKKNLNESTAKVSELSDQVESLNEELKKYKFACNSYKAKLKESKEAYIKARAAEIGVKPSEILSKLTESYKLKDVDSVCEDLSKYRNTISKLPFVVNESTHLSAKPSNEYIAGRTPADTDDYISDSLLKFIQ